jgi:hypothetical protein
MKEHEMSKACRMYGRNTKFWSGSLKGRDNFEHVGIEWMLEKLGGKVWNGSIWLRIETSIWLL